MNALYMTNSENNLRWVYGEAQRARLASLVSLYPQTVTDIETLSRGGFEDAEFIFSTWGMLPLSNEVIARALPRLRAVFYAAGSVRGFAEPFLQAGIPVYSAWQANAVPVVEYTVAQIILAAKGYFRIQPATRTSRAAAHALSRNYPGNYNIRVGLLGCGAIGSRVAKALGQLSMEVLVFDPFLSEARAAELGVRKAEMDEIFKTCFIVSNHLANLKETVGIIKRDFFLSMMPYSTFINTGRGPQLCEDDLYDMLTQDTTRTALIDVMTDETHSDDNRLNALDNCLITPHIAGSGGHEVCRMAEYMINAYETFRDGKPCDYLVTNELFATMA